MNIGIFSECYKPTVNGVVRSIETFRNQLERMGHRIFIFAPRTRGYKEIKDAHIFRLPSITYPAAMYYPIAIPFSPSISKIIPKLKLDIIHAQSIFPVSRFGLKQAKKYQIPIVMTYHTLLTEYTHYVPLPQSFVKKEIIVLTHNFANECDQVIVPSRGVRKILIEYGVKKHKINIIPTGIEKKSYTKIPIAKIREKYHIPTKKKYLLFTGRLAKEKNIDFLFKVFKKVLIQISNAHLILLGGGPLETQLQKTIKEQFLQDNITLTGFVSPPEVAQFYRLADVFTFPSVTDTQGIVILEAFQQGLPAVAINALGPADVIRSCKDGFLARHNVDDFAQKVIKILKYPRLAKVMSKNAMKRVNNFTAEKMTNKLLSVYRKAIAKHHLRKMNNI